MLLLRKVRSTPALACLRPALVRVLPQSMLPRAATVSFGATIVTKLAQAQQALAMPVPAMPVTDELDDTLAALLAEPAPGSARAQRQRARERRLEEDEDSDDVEEQPPVAEVLEPQDRVRSDLFTHDAIVLMIGKPPQCRGVV